MKRVAVLGNSGAGKSTLSAELARITGLPLYVIDKMQFADGGEAVPQNDFLAAHNNLMREDEWIVDGYGSDATVWERFEKADTLIHIDLPIATHYWWATKRFIKGFFRDPPGWPKGSPLWSSTRQSYRVIGPCHRDLTPKYRAYVAEAAQRKNVHHLRSRQEINEFLDRARREHRK